MKATFDVEQVLREMTTEEKAQMCSGRDFWYTQDNERLGIPGVMMCDGPNGLRKQVGEGDHLGINESIETVCYPTSSAFAASFDRELLEQLGELLGQECQAEHVAMLLGPGVNIKRSPLCGRNFEYFSEDPYLAGKLAAAYIRGLQGQGVAACVKHFAANNQETRRMSGSSQVEERTLREIYLPAFEAAVKEGHTRSIMCAYNAINGVFCSENGELLNDILRKEWGFDGFVVTDWGATKRRPQGIQAGVDLEMPGSREGRTEPILKALEDGTLTMEELDQAVRNQLRFVKAALENQKEDAVFDRAKARKRAEEFAGECAVLLKNEGVLPLGRERKLAFIGSFAGKPRYQGAGSSHINEKHPAGALECTAGLQAVYAKGYDPSGEETDPELLREAVEAAAKAEAAVIFAGLPESFETEGCDREHMAMPENQNELIREVAKVQKNTIVVLHGGSPMELPWFDEVAGVLLMHLGGSAVGGAAVKLLTGEWNPSGKLAETWPLRLEDTPSYLNFPGENGIVSYRENLFVGYRYYDKKKMPVRFPFGFGLSYTTFAYSDLKLSSQRLGDGEVLRASWKVKNTGARAGKEAVQLYVAPKGSGMIRPIKELKGFAKVALEPGEEKEVSFELDRRAFAYYEERVHDWFVESGSYEILAGASAEDIRLAAEVQVDSKDEIPIVYTRFSTIGDLAATERGRALLGSLMGQADSSQEMHEAEMSQNMGEGTSKMMQAMMMEMPLGALVSYGRVTEEQLEGMLQSLA
ncbi:MAG: glycoside hydrolase family 3 C-terminal domain-containing protein [Roseburia sp.]|nr:glycoside hydrolase family 3 C-terminal domain-containing protein [Roseburia sp.]MCM1098584.1 glycoside hydrolase family 3 C-terminal domain-containing protein [Ruminococcus flavefaciens]